MDISGLSAFLISSGPWGVVVLYLLWDRHALIQRIDKCHETYTADLLRIVGEVTKAVAASTAAMQTNVEVQSRAASSAQSIAEAVKILQLAIANLEKDIERMDRETGA